MPAATTRWRPPGTTPCSRCRAASATGAPDRSQHVHKGRKDEYMRRFLTIGLAAAAVAAAVGTVNASPARAATCSGYVGLTFDDGPTNTTSTLLAALTKSGLRATMFNEGRF